MASHHGVLLMTMFLMHLDRFFQLLTPVCLSLIPWEGQTLPSPCHNGPVPLVLGEGRRQGLLEKAFLPHVAQATQVPLHCALPLPHGCGWQVPKEEAR